MIHCNQDIIEKIVEEIPNIKTTFYTLYILNCTSKLLNQIIKPKLSYFSNRGNNIRNKLLPVNDKENILLDKYINYLYNTKLVGNDYSIGIPINPNSPFILKPTKKKTLIIIKRESLHNTNTIFDIDSEKFNDNDILAKIFYDSKIDADTVIKAPKFYIKSYEFSRNLLNFYVIS